MGFITWLCRKKSGVGYKIMLWFFCPNEAAAMGNIVVSLPYTTYLWAALIALCFSRIGIKEQG